jgi:uncharacterized protein YndB with AHSA1/START domain
MKSDVKMGPGRLEITRVFDAPRERVFDWWKQPEKLRRWSGCKEATQCEVEMDFRVGGGFIQTMQIAGCGEFKFSGSYEEIVEPEKIVYRANLGPAVTKETVEFFDEAGRTRVVMTQEGFPDDFLCRTVSQGTTESFDKLDLALLESSANDYTVHRQL